MISISKNIQRQLSHLIHRTWALEEDVEKEHETDSLLPILRTKRQCQNSKVERKGDGRRERNIKKKITNKIQKNHKKNTKNPQTRNVAKKRKRGRREEGRLCRYST